MCVVLFLLGMLLFHMLKSFCGCKKVVEGLNSEYNEKQLYLSLSNNDKKLIKSWKKFMKKAKKPLCSLSAGDITTPGSTKCNWNENNSTGCYQGYFDKMPCPIFDNNGIWLGTIPESNKIHNCISSFLDYINGAKTKKDIPNKKKTIGDLELFIQNNNDNNVGLSTGLFPTPANEKLNRRWPVDNVYTNASYGNYRLLQGNKTPILTFLKDNICDIYGYSVSDEGIGDLIDYNSNPNQLENSYAPLLSTSSANDSQTEYITYSDLWFLAFAFLFDSWAQSPPDKTYLNNNSIRGKCIIDKIYPHMTNDVKPKPGACACQK
tara:strand:- start:4472 stop:5431 length:960 start_codon:yes stop_codon:yes gene_type:complete